MYLSISLFSFIILKVHFKSLLQSHREISFRSPWGRMFPLPQQSPLAQSEPSAPIILFCSVLALNLYTTISSRQSETNRLKICIIQLQISGEAKSWNQNKAEHVNPAVLVIQNKVKMQMSFEHTIFLSLGPQFILYFSLPCGNILKKAGHSILKTQCLVIHLEVKGFSVCSCPSWPENL